MIRLVRVELTRLRWRRAVLVLLIAALVIPLVVLATRVYNTRPVSEGDIRDAERQVAEIIKSNEVEVQRCIAEPGSYGVDPDRAEKQCNRYFSYTPRVDDFLYREQLRIGREREASGLSVVAIIAVLMLLMGTTYAGHDWNSGSMSNQLLFDPRRIRVWAAKGLAVASTALVVGVVGLTVFWGGLWAAAESRDRGPSDQLLTDLLQYSGRGVALIVAAAVGGYLLTMLSRSTVFTVGVLFGFAVAGGLLFGALLPDSYIRFEPATNASALVRGVQDYYVEPPSACQVPQPPDDVDCNGRQFLRQGDAALYYGVLIGGLAVASGASYRRRDVP